jgi:hypothetical protein
MMHVKQCDEVRERLEELHDGELPVDDQIAIQDHLRDCIACSLAAGELDSLGDALREMAVGLPDRTSSEADRVPTRVLDQLQIERQFSLATRVRALFQDMHLVYPALGATAATIFCLVGSMSVLHAASQDRRPDSLAGVIDYLANPGSNANPMRLAVDMMAPRARTNPDSFIPFSDEDGVIAMNAVVTREGRIQGIEFVDEGTTQLKVKPAELMIMLNAASRATFEPAQARSGNTVAVSLVWVLASTTVKGRPDDAWFLRRPVAPRIPLPGPLPAARPAPAIDAPQTKPMHESACLAG